MGDAQALQDRSRRQRQQQVLGRDVVVFEVLGFGVSRLQDLGQRVAHVGLAAALHTGEAFDL